MKTPVGISNRHIHLSKSDADILFGSDYQLNVLKDLSQPGQFACQETVTISGPKGEISGVRILGPYRNHTQIEILMADTYKLGVKAPIRLSADLEGTPGIKIIGPAGTVQTDKGVIIAKRHLHIHIDQANEWGLKQGEEISIKVGGDRGVVFNNVVVRADEKAALDFHIDTEEANASGAMQGEELEIIK